MINVGIRKDSILDLLRGNVKLVETEEHEVHDGALGPVKERSVRSYDLHGNRISAEYYDSGDKLKLRQESVIDPDGNELEYNNYDSLGRHTGGGWYTYDSNGNIRSKVHDGELQEQYETDDYGRIVRVTYANTGSANEYTYDQKGLVVTQVDTPMDTSRLSEFERMMMASLLGDKRKQVFEFVNDEYGNVVDQRVYDYESRELRFQTIRKTNEHGDVIEESTHQGSKLVSRRFFGYKYDSHGNWIERTDYGPDKQAKRVKRRNITYHSPAAHDEPVNTQASAARGTASRDLSNIQFESTDHIRYQNAQNVSGRNEGAKRRIEIKPNIWGGEGYTVTIYNQDGNHSLWGNNVQMAPKQMRVVKQDQDKVELRGFGRDPMGVPFFDYGVTVYFRGDTVERIVLHMHDRNVDIEYLP